MAFPTVSPSSFSNLHHHTGRYYFRHSQAGKESYSLRGETIERVFADAKEKHGMRYTFHRGLVRVASWVRLKFAAMNLKRLALWVFRGPIFRLFCTEFAQHSQKGCLSAV